MDPGTRVEVRSRFDRAWARGFEVAEQVRADHAGRDGGSDAAGAVRYRLRRRSDGSVLPALFTGDEVREEKRRNDMWWI